MNGRFLAYISSGSFTIARGDIGIRRDAVAGSTERRARPHDQSPSRVLPKPFVSAVKQCNGRHVKTLRRNTLATVLSVRRARSGLDRSAMAFQTLAKAFCQRLCRVTDIEHDKWDGGVA
jgi:hypothetical protein